MAMLEAQAAGLPVVSCATRGVPDVVEHGRTGLLAPAGDEARFAGAGARAAARRGKRARMGAAAAAFVAQRAQPGRGGARACASLLAGIPALAGALSAQVERAARILLRPAPARDRPPEAGGDARARAGRRKARGHARKRRRRGARHGAVEARRAPRAVAAGERGRPELQAPGGASRARDRRRMEAPARARRCSPPGAPPIRRCWCSNCFRSAAGRCASSCCRCSSSPRAAPRAARDRLLGARHPGRRRRAPSGRRRRSTWCERYFDRVLVHGDPRGRSPSSARFPPRAASPAKLHYTGYVVDAAPRSASRRRQGRGHRLRRRRRGRRAAARGRDRGEAADALARPDLARARRRQPSGGGFPAPWRAGARARRRRAGALAAGFHDAARELRALGQPGRLQHAAGNGAGRRARGRGAVRGRRRNRADAARALLRRARPAGGGARKAR